MPQDRPMPVCRRRFLLRCGQRKRSAAASRTARKRSSLRCASRKASGSAPAIAASSSMNDSRAKQFAVEARARYDPSRSGESQWKNRVWVFGMS